MDYGYMIRGAVISVVFRAPPKHYLGHVVENKNPIVIIPGIFERWSFMKPLGDKLSLLGHPVYIVPKIGYNILNIPVSAGILRKVVEKIELEYPHRKVIFVAHSKGGLIGKYFLSHFDIKKRVLGMVSIATPYTGSAMASLISVQPLRELRGDSKLIADLQKKTNVNHKIISLCPEYDNHVWAKDGSRLEGAHNVILPVHGHHRVLFDNGVQEMVVKQVERLSTLVR